ncbi:Alpha-amylase type A isozyme [Glycine soja]|uniref:1,4-alpha-D-glucan glucanohydrolase n=1 Tax=Glycine soja TaxID=3848 RepID=A0A0B2SPG0_GLYSO|nr:Alpha-amylase type A isozyme [Glycine soja]
MQAFNWESNKYNWWNNLEGKVPDIAKAGFTSVWLPPPTHSFSPEVLSFVYMCCLFQGNRSTGDIFHGFPNIDHTKDFVRKDIIGWLRWLRHEVGFHDFRFGFVKGFSPKYVKEYIEGAKPLFCVGEYWHSCNYKGSTLDYNQEAVKGDFWRLCDPQGKPPGVIGWWPSRSVTFVDDHDTGSTQIYILENSGRLLLLFIVHEFHVEELIGPSQKTISWRDPRYSIEESVTSRHSKYITCENSGGQARPLLCSNLREGVHEDWKWFMVPNCEGMDTINFWSQLRCVAQVVFCWHDPSSPLEYSQIREGNYELLICFSIES